MMKLLSVSAGVALGWCATTLLGAGIPEPATVFYGRVVNRTSGPDYVVTSGQLEWVVDGGAVAGGTRRFTTKLEPLGDGSLSYRLKIPLELEGTTDRAVVNVLPVGSQAVRFRHVRVRVDGQPARLLTDAPGFDVEQTARAATYRIDLEVTQPLPDTDRDGLPDWWEQRYGSNPGQPDARVRLPGGLTYAESFRLGVDPRTDHRQPQLVTESFHVFAGGTTWLPLRTVDTDTPPERLQYAVTELPAGGDLIRQSAAGVRVKLGVGDGFTQAEVDAGQVRFEHAGVEKAAVRFGFSVRDEDPTHPVSTGVVTAKVFRPDELTETAPEFWLDASRLDDRELAEGRWIDQSGQQHDARTATGAALVRTAGPRPNRSAVALDGTALGINAGAMPLGGGSDWTALAVFRSEGNQRQQLLATPQLELGVNGSDAGASAGAIRWAMDGQAAVGTESIRGDWHMMALSRSGAERTLAIGGRTAALVRQPESSRTPVTHATLGARTTGQFDPNRQSWVLEHTEAWHGAVAEVLAYPTALPALSALRLEAYLQSKWFGAVVREASEARAGVTATAAATGERHYLFGSAQADELAGGAADDVLVGGGGNDRLRGGNGADRFVSVDANDGTDTVLDFNAAEGDALDLSRLLVGRSSVLSDYVRLQFQGTRTVVEIDAEGESNGSVDARLVLENVAWQPADLERLWANGTLLTGPRIDQAVAEPGLPRISVVASVAATGEDTGTPGEFVVSRSGSRAEALEVELRLGGTAQNGVDYASLPPRVRFAPGQAVIRWAVEPYVDSLLEPTEVVELSVLAGAGYQIGTSSSARITLADQPERFALEILEGTASRSEQAPATVRVRRTGSLDRSSLVQFQLGGTAVNGLDYQRVASTVTFAPGQVVALLTFQPKTGRPPLTGPQTIELNLVADPGGSYVLGSTSAVRLWMVEESIDFARWRAVHLAGVTGAAATVAAADTDGDRLSNLIEYAFGLNPREPDTAAAAEALPRAVLRGGRLAIEYRRPASIVDVQYRFESSEDLLVWTPAGDRFEPVELEPALAAAGRVCWQDRLPSEAARQRYVRVRVVMP